MSDTTKNNPAPGQVNSVEWTKQVQIPLVGEIKEVAEVIQRFPFGHVVVLMVIAALASMGLLLLWNAAHQTILSLVGSLTIAGFIFAFGVVAFRAAKNNGATNEPHGKETPQSRDADRST